MFWVTRPALLEGNSGSAVVDLEIGQVIGLHDGDHVLDNVAVRTGVLANRLSTL